MFNYSQFLLRFPVYSWIRVVFVTKFRSVWGTKGGQQPSSRNSCWNSINRKLSFPGAVPPVVQPPPWRGRSLYRCLLCVTHLVIPQRAGATHNKMHHYYNSSIHIKQKSSEWCKWTVIKCTAAQSEVHVAVSKTGELLLHRPPSPRHVPKATQTQPGLSSIRLFRLNQRLSLKLAAGTVRDGPIFCLSLLSRVTHVHNTKHLIHTGCAFVCYCNSGQRRQNILLWKKVENIKRSGCKGKNI